MKMREKCKTCAEDDITTWAGQVETKNGQDVVRCAWCKSWAYNQPRAESGRDIRTIRTRPDIKPAQRARVLDRDSHRCVSCGAVGDLHVGHLISVAQGRNAGLSDEELYDDDNLAAMCPECNLGFGDQTFSLRMLVTILRIRREGRAA